MQNIGCPHGECQGQTCVRPDRQNSQQRVKTLLSASHGLGRFQTATGSQTKGIQECWERQKMITWRPCRPGSRAVMAGRRAPLAESPAAQFRLTTAKPGNATLGIPALLFSSPLSQTPPGQAVADSAGILSSLSRGVLEMPQATLALQASPRLPMPEPCCSMEFVMVNDAQL
jgi:hypothetical protein